MQMSEPVSHEDDSRFFEVRHDVTDEERVSHRPSPAPDPEDYSTPREEGA